jgi:transcriptional regulator GlxA family with amidase domain
MRKNRAMTTFASDGRHRVAVLVRHGVVPMELGVVHQLFRTAVSPDGAPLYEVLTCTPDGPGEIPTDSDYSLTVAHGPELLAEADTVVVPATHEPDETEIGGCLPPAVAAALSRIRPGTRIASICTGSFVLAAAGLLDGRRATTHWMSAQQFRRLHPAVQVDPDVLYTDDGDVLTSAGEAAGIDLCLHMIRCDHGTAVANAVARRAVVSPHRDGGQAQFIERPVPRDPDASTAPARLWALDHLDQPLSLRDLATRASMSVRTFTRRFRDETGLSPAQWLTQQRVDRARQLLEDTDLPVDRIAAEAGFGTATSLRQHLHAALGVSPTSYRGTFRCPVSAGLQPATAADGGGQAVELQPGAALEVRDVLASVPGTPAGANEARRAKFERHGKRSMQNGSSRLPRFHLLCHGTDYRAARFTLPATRGTWGAWRASTRAVPAAGIPARRGAPARAAGRR